MRNLLLGDRVRLAAMTDGDLPVIAGWQRDATFLRLLDAVAAAPKTEAQLAEWFKEMSTSTSGYLFAIRPVDGDELLGWIELDGILWNQGTSWVSIAIGEAPMRGQGYGAEALRLAMRFAFGELNLRRLNLTVFAYNTAAIRVYERLGFVCEGAYREALLRDGEVHDMLLYGILRREWEALDTSTA